MDRIYRQHRYGFPHALLSVMKGADAGDGGESPSDGFALELNHSDYIDKAYSVVVDGDYFFVGGLVTAFDGDGVAETNSCTRGEMVYRVLLDGSHLYVAISDVLPGDYQWRIEKRNKTSGALVTAFEDNSIVDGVYSPSAIPGVVQSNPSTDYDSPRAIAVDSTAIYIAGFDKLPDDYQWRVEKRNKTTGALITAFEDHSIADGVYVPTVIPGVVQSNPTTGVDYMKGLFADSTYLYVYGTDSFPGDNRQWRVEKRDKTTGALVTPFEDHSITDSVYVPVVVPGVVQSNPSSDVDYVADVTVDDCSVYIVGFDESNGSGNDQWRIEKRDKTSGGF